ncbi:hypothetical protein [Nocardia thailandica]
MIDTVPGQHRTTATNKPWKPVAVWGVAATLPSMLLMTLKPSSPEVQTVGAVQAPTPAAVDLDVISAPHDEPQPPQVDPAEAEMSALKALLPCGTEFKGTRPHVAQVGHFLQKMFGLADIGGANGRFDGDHGAGLALDLMTPNAGVGNAIAEFVLANQQRFGVSYVIWQQRYNDGSGWSMMEDRGSPTQNHYDHVHVSFDASATDISLNC